MKQYRSGELLGFDRDFSYFAGSYAPGAGIYGFGYAVYQSFNSF